MDVLSGTGMDIPFCPVSPELPSAAPGHPSPDDRCRRDPAHGIHFTGERVCAGAHSSTTRFLNVGKFLVYRHGTDSA
jgi:hypothetical protein